MLSAIVVGCQTIAYGGYSGTLTEINIAAVPFDNYYTANNGLMPSCPSTYTIQQCIKLLFNNNPNSSPYSANNFVKQGVTGVRFFFSVRGGSGHSTAWDVNGNVSSAWSANLQAFLNDLHSYGITRVTPTPALDSWAQPSITPSPAAYDCSGRQPLVFYQWMPFGHIASNLYPDCQDNNAGYNSANSNPYFWGWTPFFNLFQTVFNAVRAAGLAAGDLDYYNELNPLDYTVVGRLIYDNKHGPTGIGPGHTDVLGTMRSIASGAGLILGL